MEARRRPQQEEVRYQELIDKTVEKAILEGKARNTQRKFYHLLRQLSRVCDLMNPDDAKKAIAYANIGNASKTAFVLAYEWFIHSATFFGQKREMEGKPKTRT